MAISSIGVGSGLPIDQLLEDLRKTENQALGLIQAQQVSAQNRLSAYGTLKNSIEALSTAAAALGKDDTYGALKASTASEAYGATVTNKAVAGQYNIKVDQLATAQSLVTVGKADRDTNIGAGGVVSVVIDGKTQTVDLGGKDTSLNGIMAAINNDPKLGFSATLVNDGTDTPYRLLLTAKETGTKASIQSINVDQNGDLQTLIGFDASNPTSNSNIRQQEAQIAKLEINGIKIESQTNAVEGAIEGVTLTLKKTSDVAAGLSITRDDTVSSKAITDFVSAYNSLQSTIKSLTAYNVDSQKSSALTGDGLARNIQSQIRQALNTAENEGTIKSLSQLGITTNVTNGSLEIDTDKLNAALKDNMVDVSKLFMGDTGISKKLTDVAETFTRSGGLISAATDGASRSISDLVKQYDATSDRIEAKMEGYRRQFSALDVMVNQMNGISNYLTQQLSMLGNIGKDK